VLARRGRDEQARQALEVALTAARRTDSPVTKATAFLDAAIALDELADRAGARSMARRAARSFSSKGHLIGVGWAREFLAGGSATTGQES
jgi:hypothetical protein